MLNQIQINDINIQGKNTLKDENIRNLSESILTNSSPDSINNFILNSNLESSNSIK